MHAPLSAEDQSPPVATSHVHFMPTMPLGDRFHSPDQGFHSLGMPKEITVFHSFFQRCVIARSDKFNQIQGRCLMLYSLLL